MTVSKKTVQKGFTLIEIMIALTLGLFLAAGVVQVFLSTKQSNRTQENLSRMQENARFAMYFLTEDIRKVAFDGGICGRGKIINNAINDLDSSSAEYQFKTLPIYSSLSGAISGKNNDGYTDPTGLQSDSISIRALGSLGPGVALTTPLALVSDNLQINASEAGVFAQGDIILVTDCKFSDIVQITNNLAGGSIEHATGSGETPDNKTGNVSVTYGTNAKVYRLSSDTGLLATTYTIENSFGSPGLAKDGQELVPDIENMQILYGQLDTSNGIYFVPSDTAGLDMEKVISVRVSLLVRSRDDFVATNPQPYFYNGGDVSGADIPDRRLRKVYTSTIAVRNRLN